MDKKLKIAILITVILGLAFAGVVIKMIIETGECIDDPFKYSAQRLEESGGYYDCRCNSLDQELLSFRFDTNGIHIEEELYMPNLENINFSMDSIEFQKAG